MGCGLSDLSALDQARDELARRKVWGVDLNAKVEAGQAVSANNVANTPTRLDFQKLQNASTSIRCNPKTAPVTPATPHPWGRSAHKPAHPSGPCTCHISRLFSVRFYRLPGLMCPAHPPNQTITTKTPTVWRPAARRGPTGSPHTGNSFHNCRNRCRHR